jgi:hypothetical protein
MYCAIVDEGFESLDLAGEFAPESKEFQLLNAGERPFKKYRKHDQHHTTFAS